LRRNLLDETQINGISRKRRTHSDKRKVGIENGAMKVGSGLQAPPEVFSEQHIETTLKNGRNTFLYLGDFLRISVDTDDRMADFG
jgi:hypothetical protein